jgi:uncharacterized membrane protein
MTMSHPLARDEQIRAITVFNGWATANGNVGGTTIVDTKLVGVNDYVTNKAVLIMSGACKWELQRVASFVAGTGTITVNAAFSAQITSGVLYKLLNFGIGADFGAIIAALVHLGLDTDAIIVTLAHLGVDTDALIVALANVYSQVNAIQTLTETGGTITSTAAELDIFRIETPMGIFKPIALKIDLTNMLAADDLTIRIYERIVPGGNLIRGDVMNYAGVQTVEPVSPLKTISLDPNRFGIQVTIDENGASGHVVCPWAIAYEV